MTGALLDAEAVAIWGAMESYQETGGVSNLPIRRERAAKATSVSVRTLSKAKQVVDSG